MPLPTNESGAQKACSNGKTFLAAKYALIRGRYTLQFSLARERKLSR